MCNMDKCNFKDFTNDLYGNSSLKEILSIVMKKEQNFIDGVNFYDTLHSNGKYFVFDYRTKVLLSMSKDNYARKLLDTSRQGNQYKVYKIHGRLVLVIRRAFRPQIGNFLSSIYSTFKNINQLTQTMSQSVKDGDAWLLFLDLINMILNIRDGYFTPQKVLTTIISLYTIYRRVCKKFAPQIFDSYEILTFILSLIGVPESCKTVLINYSLLTGKRLFSSDFIFSILSSLYTTFKCMLMWLSTQCHLPEMYANIIISYLDCVFGNILCYNKIKNVVDLYTKYGSNPEIILHPEFRHEVIVLHENLKDDNMFKDYVTNHDNKFFREIWSLFNNNLVKYVNTFTNSQKDEPICIVFEGEPGSGKSVLMNAFVEVLKSKNKSVYVHSVPPSEGGKDFYDDYENQEVFVMDDVGQQGKSQWRTIINFVSPVKYPLECANAAKKNTKFFNSKVILCTTNNFKQLSSFTSKDCIAEPEALFRRAHVVQINRGSDPAYFSQNLSYFKFDHITSKRWENSFLHHNSNITLKTSVVTHNLRDSLRYVRMLLERIEENEIKNRNSVKITPNDLAYIDQDTDDFEAFFDPQAGFDIFSQPLFEFFVGLRKVWRPLANGTQIFNEWLSYLLTPCKDFISTILKYLHTFFFGKETSETRRIVKAIKPSDILGSEKDKDRNFRTLSLRYHPDKYVDNDLFTREEGIFVFLLINLANTYYNDPDEFFTQRHFRVNDKERFQGALADLFKSEHIAFDHRHYIFSTLSYLKYTLFDVFSRLEGYQFVVIFVYVLYFSVCFYVILFQSDEQDFDQEDLRARIKRLSKKIGTEFAPQTQVNRTISKFVKFLVISSDDRPDFLTHGIVSGNRLLINSHAVFNNPVVTVYSSYDHYIDNHAEIEKNKIKLVSDFPSCDLAVFEFSYLHSLYPTCNPLFKSRDITPQLFLCTSIMEVPLAFNKNVFLNDVVVEYAQYGSKKSFSHESESGLITPIEGDGLCGSFVYNSHGDIIAVHSAGDGSRGFCVIPSGIIGKEIRELMSSVRNLQLEIDTRIIPNFSGARLVYGKDVIETSYPNGKSTIIPSILHADACYEMASFIDYCNTEIASEDFVYTKIDKRGPPIINNPIQTIYNTSTKTFMNQGSITTEEMLFVKECIRALMPIDTFDDLDDDVAAFGNEDFAPLNKSSSNGYGHPIGKDKYFDFEKREISQDFKDEFNSFIQRVKSNEYDFKDFISKECFKVDELRNESKREVPRTIRVLPVTHIWLTKKIFGKLALYISKHKHENGIGLGFNPFVDFDILYKKLSDPSIGATGDLDAAKWDGSLVGELMIAILEVMFEKYNGQYKFAKDFLITSIVRCHQDHRTSSHNR